MRMIGTVFHICRFITLASSKYSNISHLGLRFSLMNLVAKTVFDPLLISDSKSIVQIFKEVKDHKCEV